MSKKPNPDGRRAVSVPGFLSVDDAKKDGRAYSNILCTPAGVAVHQLIISGVEKGLPNHVAAYRAKISIHTLRKWLQIGSAVEKQLELMGQSEVSFINEELKPFFTPAEKACFELLVDMRKAEADCIHRATLSVVVAGQKHWQAAAWYLSRRSPDFKAKKEIHNTGQPQTVVNVGTDGQIAAAFQSAVSELSVEQKRALLQTFAAMRQKTGDVIDGKVSNPGQQSE